MKKFILPVLTIAALACGESVTISDDDAGPDPDPVGDMGPAPDPIPPGTSTSATLGAEGGTLALDELTLEVPAGALSEDTEITITATDAAAPTGFTTYSPVFRFEPAGLEFAAPVTVRLPFDGNGSVASVFWTTTSGEFTARATRVEGFEAIAEIRHFSQGFVGTACEDCCRRATGALDLLLMVDNSGSMAEEQASLAAEIPRLIQVLATGDLDGDGTQEFPAVESLQVGVITSDMGAGGIDVPTCNDPAFGGNGDDGILRTSGNTANATCMATYPSWLTFAAGDDATALASDVACVTTAVGTNGCGFEQQLDAMLKATTPSTSGITFTGGTVGHGDGDNAGFIRDEAVLALVSLTDEDDCSAVEPELFDPDSTTYSIDLNLRCFSHPEAVHPIARYVDGFVALKDDPGQLVYATISGIPADLEGASWEAILADERMVEMVNPSMPTQLVPSCDVPGRGRAFPPRRMVQTAADLEAAGAKAAAASICNESFDGAIGTILERVAAGVSGSCD